MRILILAVFALTHVYMGSAGRILKEEFNAAIASLKAPAVDAEIYELFAKATEQFSREELAMFLAQVMHDSSCFEYREEQRCKVSHCPNEYVDQYGLPGKYYYGRGYIHLAWAANYKEASEGLGMGDYLLKNPEVVAEDAQIAMRVSVWFWEARVRPVLGNSNKFGLTTKAINGRVECSAGSNKSAADRYQTYLNVANVLAIQSLASENGCYN